MFSQKSRPHEMGRHALRQAVEVPEQAVGVPMQGNADHDVGTKGISGLGSCHFWY